MDFKLRGNAKIGHRADFFPAQRTLVGQPAIGKSQADDGQPYVPTTSSIELAFEHALLTRRRWRWWAIIWPLRDQRLQLGFLLIG
jgi:hypothetical protein